MSVVTKSIKRRSGLGANPLDILMPEEEAPATPTSTSKPRRTSAALAPAPRKSNGTAHPESKAAKKVRATYHLPEDLVENLRNAALHLAGPPAYLTLSALVESALRKELERMQDKHHKGKPFPQRPHDLRGGRPVGS